MLDSRPTSSIQPAMIGIASNAWLAMQIAAIDSEIHRLRPSEIRMMPRIGTITIAENGPK